LRLHRWRRGVGACSDSVADCSWLARSRSSLGLAPQLAVRAARHLGDGACRPSRDEHAASARREDA
jgi:hypothetical protein